MPSEAREAGGFYLIHESEETWSVLMKLNKNYFYNPSEKKNKKKSGQGLRVKKLVAGLDGRFLGQQLSFRPVPNQHLLRLQGAIK